MTAEERRKASGPLIYWAAAAPAHRGAATGIGAPFGAPPPSLGSKDIFGKQKTSASRPFEASFLGKREGKPGCEWHRGNAVPRRHCRASGGDERVLFDIVDRTTKTPVRDGGALDPGYVLPAYFTVMTKPLRSALTMAPTELPVSVSTAPCWLVSTMACAPRPSAAPTFPAA